MPVDGSRSRQTIVDRQRYRVTLAPLQDGPRNGSVNGRRPDSAAREVDRQPVDHQIEAITRQHCGHIRRRSTVRAMWKSRRLNPRSSTIYFTFPHGR